MAMVPVFFVTTSMSSWASFSTSSRVYPSLELAPLSRPLPPKLSDSRGVLPILRHRAQLNSSRHAGGTTHEGEAVLQSSERFDSGRISDCEESSPWTVGGKSGPASNCPLCGRRHALAGGVLGAIVSAGTNRVAQAYVENYDPKRVAEVIRPAWPGWYEEFFALQMQSGMQSYEIQMAGYKDQLFNSLDEKAQEVLELGIGTGPNIKYYANRPHVKIIGVDPNSHMEKYAQAAASEAGLLDSQFNFVQGVGEALPVATSSVDAVICTLVLCSVKDVAASLKEVQRVLKPGGSFLFIEHVAAPEGSNTRFWQNFLDPVQQFVSGCHLTRNTLRSIEEANFVSVEAKNINVPILSVLSSQIIGIAQT